MLDQAVVLLDQIVNALEANNALIANNALVPSNTATNNKKRKAGQKKLLAPKRVKDSACRDSLSDSNNKIIQAIRNVKGPKEEEVEEEGIGLVELQILAGFNLRFLENIDLVALPIALLSAK